MDKTAPFSNEPTIVPASFTILTDLDTMSMLRLIEMAGRLCYKSEGEQTEEGAERFIANLIKQGHESVIEHGVISVHVVCDRGVSHQIVRHRIASYSQESTRYCNYSQARFNKNITFIRPPFANNKEAYDIWYIAMKAASTAYFSLIEKGSPPDDARSVLPNSLKTEIIMTMNLRQWRHFFCLRTTKQAHSQIREIAIPLLAEMKSKLAVVFNDIVVEEESI